MTSSSSDAELAQRVRGLIRNVPDFPEPGIVFRDITPLLADGPTFGEVIEHLADRYRGRIDMVAGVEARGFLLSAPLSAVLGVGTMVVRKAGKLPPPTISSAYTLEYGTAEVEVAATVVVPGQRVLLLDDVLATGGTAGAAASLLEQAGLEVSGIAMLMELSELGGRAALGEHEVYSVVTY
ncbi:adenine phosphoribosyltransferase [Pseudactinotalea sp. HY160]|uniref:adenine phosphoribosyltransferase n=1 Tax=Pseudactinotalea sp. HY160 TaxID=2654490 RepID=UPI00128C550D|nr:adenine phosphoribosyltransferase [Pseudactinotalea sp. HY160]MPV49363.1 adenine phosphoribosyltransferase [Pseudactinotalea sp. HY160]